MTSTKIFQLSRPPLSSSKLLPPLDLEPPVSNEPSPPLQMIANQLKEKIIQGWLSYVIRSFLQVSLHIQYQLINLIWLSFDFFSFG